MPAGMEIIMAIEKLKATITNAVLVFLLDMFLTALVKAPKPFTLLGFDSKPHLLLKNFSILDPNPAHTTTRATDKTNHARASYVLSVSKKELII
jgi:hypothetical protein